MANYIEVKTNQDCFLYWYAENDEDFYKKKEEANELRKGNSLNDLISFNEEELAVGVSIPNLTFNSEFDSDNLVLKFLATQSTNGSKIFLGTDPISTDIYKSIFDLLSDNDGETDFMGWYTVFDSKSGDTYACTIEGFDENGLIWDCELD